MAKIKTPSSALTSATLKMPVRNVPKSTLTKRMDESFLPIIPLRCRKGYDRNKSVNGRSGAANGHSGPGWLAIVAKNGRRATHSTAATEVVRGDRFGSPNQVCRACQAFGFWSGASAVTPTTNHARRPALYLRAAPVRGDNAEALWELPEMPPDVVVSERS